KLNSSGSSLLYGTYLGGALEDVSRGIVLDTAGNAYVTGETTSAGWATNGAYETTLNGGIDAFVAELNDTGSTLLYCTYLGGAATDSVLGIDVDTTGNAYVTGETQSAGLATGGAYDTTYNGGNFDVFVAKLDSTGSSLAYFTYLGGNSEDVGLGIA